MLIEVPRWSWIKRGPTGAIDVMSPIPCPFNYGCVPDVVSGDLSPLDAIVLGPRRPVGLTEPLHVLGAVEFIDDGRADPKLVCAAAAALSDADRAALALFFRAYAPLKRALGWMRGHAEPTAAIGLFER